VSIEDGVRWALVSDTLTDWPRELRELPAQLVAEAAANPGGSVAEIDAELVPDPDGFVPPEAIIGVFPVGLDGKPTGEFVRNPGYGSIRDDLTRLVESDHWLGWLPDDPPAAVRTAIEDLLDQQVEGSQVEWIKATEEPVFLTGGRQLADDEERIVVTRAGLALPFALGALPPDGRREILMGVFSWAAGGLDTPDGRRDQVWLDLFMTREHAEGLLPQRVEDV